MPGTPNQKQKLLVLLDLLWRRSDEEHPLPVQELLELLRAEGFPAERKSLYSDLRVLSDCGHEIVYRRGQGYYLASRPFRLPELRMLVDAVQSARFITQKKSGELIARLERLGSEHQAVKLQRQVRILARNKAENEDIYAAVDALHSAIDQGRQVRFQYFQYNVHKERELRRSGERYQVSPFALVWNNDNYYLVAFDSQTQELRHYRVDRMLNLELTQQLRDGREAYRSFELASYTEAHFGMFSGETQWVVLRCQSSMVSVILDRFGQDTLLSPDGESRFTATVQAAVSPQFFGWLFGLGDQVEILSPAPVRRQFRQELSRVMGMYRDTDKPPSGLRPATPFQKGAI